MTTYSVESRLLGFLPLPTRRLTKPVKGRDLPFLLGGIPMLVQKDFNGGLQVQGSTPVGTYTDRYDPRQPVSISLWKGFRRITVSSHQS
ncbi:MAG TPA: hypothetical protein VLB73_01380 [Patescibacteria group bacterium]|nr:hypothetical protein [Patescibacteria group bacterium]